MARSFASLAAIVLLGGSLALGNAGTDLFSVNVPAQMVTGHVFVSARTADENVAAVRWSVDDWSRLTQRPFELDFDTGPVPYERRVVAVALDKDRRPLYRQEAVLNPGGRAIDLRFVGPIDGQRVSGTVPVALRVTTPADDEPAGVDLDTGSAKVVLTPAGRGVFRGTVEVPGDVTALVARLRTRKEREAERTIVLNAPGVVAESEVHVVQQLVGVSRHGIPLEDLKREDFTIRDEKGACELREAMLLRNAPLALGFAIDISVSLHHTEELKRATADQFIGNVLTEKDAAFVLAFGPEVTRVVDWTGSKEAVRKGVLSLSDYSVAGTELYDAIVKALYQFQGQEGARALILVTDGYDYEGSVSEETALAYARQAGVKIYVLGLTSGYDDVTKVTRRKPDGEVEVVETKRRTVVQPTNVEVLSRFAEATGGKIYLVEKEDLSKIYRSIEHDIRTQYLVSYMSNVKRQSIFHPVVVKASRGKVQTAPGFFY